MTIVFCDHKETENHVKELHVENLKLVHEKLPSTPLDTIPTKTRIPVLKIEAKRHPWLPQRCQWPPHRITPQR